MSGAQAPAGAARPITYEAMIRAYTAALAPLRPAARSVALLCLSRLLAAAGLPPAEITLVVAAVRRDLTVPVEPADRLAGEELEIVQEKLLEASRTLGLVVQEPRRT
ncbi:MAG: hypothetical protein QOJ54_565 [Aliidongia sp.]|jgi:hypothetical protein|nr:hypothetical protein [Aliidongia sp.]